MKVRSYYFNSHTFQIATCTLPEAYLSLKTKLAYNNRSFSVRSIIPEGGNTLCVIFTEDEPKDKNGVILCINDDHQQILGDVVVVGLSYDPYATDENNPYKNVELQSSLEALNEIIKFIQEPSLLQ